MRVTITLGLCPGLASVGLSQEVGDRGGDAPGEVGGIGLVVIGVVGAAHIGGEVGTQNSDRATATMQKMMIKGRNDHLQKIKNVHDHAYIQIKSLNCTQATRQPKTA